MMEVTSCWVRGQRFADLLSLQKDVFEGSLVRALRRTEELMGQVGDRGGGAGERGWLWGVKVMEVVKQRQGLVGGAAEPDGPAATGLTLSCF